MINFTQKAQEISHALVRVAVYIRRKDLRQRIESLSFDLIESINKREYEQTILTIDSLSSFLKLGSALYEVETLNSRIIIGELSLLGAGIRQLFGLDKISDPSVLFPSSVSDETESGEEINLPGENTIKSSAYGLANVKLSELNNAAIPIRQSATSPQQSEEIGKVDEELGNSAIVDEAISENVITSVITSEKDELNKLDTGMVSIGNTIRQNAILDKIRAMSQKDATGYITGCRMKDLMATFSSVSERTLRYDLQKLVGRGSVERMGNGGPSSVYVIK